MRLAAEGDGNFSQGRDSFHGMVVPSYVAAMALGWTLGCCIIYAILRWLDIQLLSFVHCCGQLVLCVWVILFVGMVSTARFWSGENYPLNVPVGIAVVMIVGFGVGSVLWKLTSHTTEESWWHGFLFSALYFGSAHVWGHTLLVCWPPRSGPLYEIAQWAGRATDYHLIMLCVWFFPLGAPLMEVGGRNMQRLRRELVLPE